MEERRPVISVIVPVYNTLEYLPRCVDSLRRQTCRELEILLVDDGSTDGSAQLCDRLAGEDERIRVFHKENGGSSSARNLGIKEAKGQYIGFVDSDDYVEPDMYELLLAAVRTYGVRAAQTGRDEIDPQGNRLPDICVPPAGAECIPPEDFLRELLLHRGDCSFCTKLLERELLADRPICFPEGVLNEDFHLLVQLLGKIGAIVSLPKQCYHVFYRVGSNSRRVGKNDFSRVFADNVSNADMVTELVEREYPQLSETAFRFGIVQRLDYMLHIPIAQMRDDNEMYRRVVAYLRKNWRRALKNRLLSGKDKLYHTLFAVSPRGIRLLHARLRGLPKR